MPPDGTITDAVGGGAGGAIGSIGAPGGLAAGAVGGIASAAGNVIGASINSATTEQINQEQMAFNANQAQLNRDYQTNMSNTAYQRATADMKAAGINPMLAYMQGGASSPSGSTASTSLNVPRPGDAISQGIQGGLSTAKDIIATKSNLDQQAASTAASITQAELNQSTAKKVQADETQIHLKNEQIANETPAAAAEAVNRQKHADIQANWAGYDETVNRLKNSIGVGTSALDLLNPMKSFGGSFQPKLGAPYDPGPVAGNLTPAQADYINKTNFYNNLWSK